MLLNGLNILKTFPSGLCLDVFFCLSLVRVPERLSIAPQLQEHDLLQVSAGSLVKLSHP